MDKQTQQQIIKDLLFAYKGGINRVWVTETYFIVDVPTRIFELKKELLDMGYTIETRREKNRTATYYLKPIEVDLGISVTKPEFEQVSMF